MLEREARLDATLREPYDPVARYLQAHPQHREFAKSVPNFERLCRAVRQKAPRLFNEHFIPALIQSAKLGWTRPLDDWKPSGKGKERLFRSLSRHLFSRYPTPEVIWSILFHPDAEKLRVVVSHVGTGGSFFQLIKNGQFPIPLTKKQCHRVLNSPDSYDFLMSVRAAQFADLGTDRHLLAAWIGSESGSRLGTPQAEEFFLSFVRLCAQTPMFDVEQFEPLLDYLLHRRRENSEFSLKGRTVQSLLRGMEEWHAELHLRQVSLANGQAVFTSSGFRAAVYGVTIHNKGAAPVRKTWRIHEILSAQELFNEGKSQKHCVASYGRRVLEGSTSIWSLTLNEGGGPERCLTIQVENKQKTVVQIRGFANRRAHKPERKVIERWAGENCLRVTASA